jgi:hypothetical protein
MKSTFKSFALAAALVALSAGSAAMAQTTLKADAGAAAGGVPEAVKIYVTHMSGAPYPYSGFEIKVGARVDAGEVFRKVPQYAQYSYANLNGQVVLIDSNSQKVVAIY